MALLRLVASVYTIPSLLRSAGATSQISHFQLPSSAHHSVSLGAKGQTMLTFYNDMDGFFFLIQEILEVKTMLTIIWDDPSVCEMRELIKN